MHRKCARAHIENFAQTMAINILDRLYSPVRMRQVSKDDTGKLALSMKHLIAGSLFPGYARQIFISNYLDQSNFDARLSYSVMYKHSSGS